jgi:cytochrome bd ubiquinol oxidase subunit II
VFGSLLALFFYHSKGREKSAFVCSCLYLAGMLGGEAFAMYPNVLMASGDAANNLTIANTVTGSYGMQIAIRWLTFGIIIAISVFRVSLSDVPRQGSDRGRR